MANARADCRIARSGGGVGTRASGSAPKHHHNAIAMPAPPLRGSSCWHRCPRLITLPLEGKFPLAKMPAPHHSPLARKFLLAQMPVPHHSPLEGESKQA